MSEPGAPVGLTCPGCGQLALGLIGYEQAICGNENCEWFIWNPAMTIQDLIANTTVIDLTWLETPDA